MNKAEFAVCRIKEKLPGNQGFLTKGSGCVVHCERLTTSWGWKCHYFIVTPSVVLCREDLSSDKMFVVEFLSKDKRGLETFEVKQMAEVCKDLPGHSLDEVGRGHYLSFLSVEPLDKRGFLKKMVKKGSLQTFRPLDCVDSQSKSEKESLINEGLYCHVIVDLFNESTNLPFSTQTFKLVYESQTRQFSLQDFGGSVVTLNQEKPPIGAVIFTKKGEFAGVLDFVHDCTVSPVFLPESSMTENSQEEDLLMPSNGVNASTAVSNNDEEHLTEQRNNQEEKIYSGSDILCDENTHAVKVSVDDMSHGNNNAMPPSEGFPADVELANTVKSEVLVFDEGSGRSISQQDQGYSDNFISGAEADKLQTDNVLDCIDSTANLKSNIKEFPEEDISHFPDMVEEGSNKMEDLDRSVMPSSAMEKPYCVAKATNGVDSNAEIEQCSLSGNNIITTNENSLVTVIQVGEIKPVGMETSKQTGTSDEEIAECDQMETSQSEVVPPENEGSIAREQSDVEETVVKSLPDDKDGQMMETSNEESVVNQENVATDDSDLCVYTENEPVALVGSRPGDAKIETDFIQKPDTHVAIETSDEKMTLVAQEDKDLTDSSECTVNRLLDNCEVSIYVTPPNGEDVNKAEDDDKLKECPSLREDVPEDLCQKKSSAEVSFTTETSDEMEGEERQDSQLNVNNDTELPGTEFTQGSSAVTSLNLEEVDAEDNAEVMYKDLDEHIEAELGQYSPRFDGDQAVITHKEFFKVADEAFVSAEMGESSDHKQSELDTEEMTTAESPELIVETQADKHSIKDTLSSDVGASEKSGADVGSASEPAADVEQGEGIEQEECSDSIEDALSSNVHALEKRTGGQEARDASEAAADVEQAEGFDKEVHSDSIEDTLSSNVSALEKRIGGQEVRDTSEASADVEQAEGIHKEMDSNSLEKRIGGQDVRTASESDADVKQADPVDKEICEDFIKDTLSLNVDTLEKRTDGQDVTTASVPAADVKQADAVDKELCGDLSLDDALVLQRVDADSLLTETITNNSHILRDLGKCLDTEYQYGRVPCWRDLAELLDIPPEAYEHCGTFSVTSPTEDLFVFLAATKPQLTIQDIKEALKEIDRHDVAQLLDRKIAGGIISKESVVGSLVERDDTDILSQMALKLDRKSKNDWKGLALQLCVPHRVLRNFGYHQQHNSSLMLLKYIPIFDPELTLENLKACLVSIGRLDAVKVLDNAGIPGDEPVRDILDDSDLLDQITDLLNEDPPSPHWRHLAKELKIPQEKCKIFEPTVDSNSPTKLLFKSIENCEPDLTFEELVLALVAMKRQDVLDVLQKYFSSDDIDQILEENNLLAPMEDHPDENES